VNGKQVFTTENTGQALLYSPNYAAGGGGGNGGSSTVALGGEPNIGNIQYSSNGGSTTTLASQGRLYGSFGNGCGGGGIVNYPAGSARSGNGSDGVVIISIPNAI
jgi:hypothetical protein